MEDLGLSINAFARELDVSSATAHRLVTEKAAISPEMAIRLSVTVGHTAHHWLGYQVDYDLYLARKQLDVSRLLALQNVRKAHATSTPDINLADASMEKQVN